jgi:hypothetical protein
MMSVSSWTDHNGNLLIQAEYDEKKKEPFFHHRWKKLNKLLLTRRGLCFLIEFHFRRPLRHSAEMYKDDDESS